MAAEQDVLRLMETKMRIERLISYYRGMGEQELRFALDLEARLHEVAAALKAAPGPAPVPKPGEVRPHAGSTAFLSIASK